MQYKKDHYLLLKLKLIRKHSVTHGRAIRKLANKVKDVQTANDLRKYAKEGLKAVWDTILKFNFTKREIKDFNGIYDYDTSFRNVYKSYKKIFKDYGISGVKFRFQSVFKCG